MGVGTPGVFVRFLAGLRTPTLFKIAATIFLVDLAVPDLIPVVDELLLGILTLIAARRKPSADRTPVRP